MKTRLAEINENLSYWQERWSCAKAEEDWNKVHDMAAKVKFYEQLQARELDYLERERRESV